MALLLFFLKNQAWKKKSGFLGNLISEYFTGIQIQLLLGFFIPIFNESNKPEPKNSKRKIAQADILMQKYLAVIRWEQKRHGPKWTAPGSSAPEYLNTLPPEQPGTGTGRSKAGITPGSLLWQSSRLWERSRSTLLWKDLGFLSFPVVLGWPQIVCKMCLFQWEHGAWSKATQDCCIGPIWSGSLSPKWRVPNPIVTPGSENFLGQLYCAMTKESFLTTEIANAFFLLLLHNTLHFPSTLCHLYITSIPLYNMATRYIQSPAEIW